ncbi:molecular chaperone HtpG [bacterium]
MQNKQTFEYKAEMKQLLHLIVHSLYTHPEIFLRELISNASDALNKVRYMQLTNENIIDKDTDLKIEIKLDKENQTFSIQDNGVGMTYDDLVNNIGTVAQSGTLEFLKRMKEENKDPGDLIGQFGVGFYSTFMVTDKITIETRSALQDSKAFRWISEGEGSYTIEEIEKPKRGTTISFKLKDEAKDFSEEFKIKEVIKKYSNFADFPIYVGAENVNTVEALWRKNSKEITDSDANEFYKFITNDYEDPLAHLHLWVESVGAEFKALLFISKRAPHNLMHINQHKTVELYSNKIMIMDDCKDLLPEYLRFVRGVVDTSDLPLNVSRETLQSSQVTTKIRASLATKIIQWIKRLADEEKEKYLEFYKNFGSLLKTGINFDFTNKDTLIELLRFETSELPSGEYTSLKEYVLRMKENQKEIYYLAGDTRAQLEANPNLEYFKKNNIEVIFLLDPVDVFIFPTIMKYEEKDIKSVEQGDIDLEGDIKDETSEDNDFFKSLVKLFKDTLKDKVEDVRVSKRLVDSAVTLVASSKGMDKQMERMMQMMGQDVPKAKKIMEINMSHPLIRNLSKKYLENKDLDLLQKYIIHLFESAELVDGDLPSRSEYVKRMMEILEKATE